MDVWVVYASEFGDPNTVVGVYPTEEEARASIAEHDRLHVAAWRALDGRRWFTTFYDIAGPFTIGAAWSPYLKADA